MRLVAPLLCFTAEEVWSHLPKRDPSLVSRPADLPSANLASVHLALFPEAAELAGDLAAAQLERIGNWDRLIAVRNEVLKALEVARKEKFIGNSLEAKVEISATGEWARLLAEYRDSLPMVFLVSQVQLVPDGLPGATASGTEGLIRGLRIAVRRAEGLKCERCWNYSVHVGEAPDFPSVCERCVAALKTMQIPNPKS